MTGEHGLMQRAAIVIGPMGIGEVLDGAFTIGKRNYRGLLIVAAWGGVPSYLALGLAGAGGNGSRSSLVGLSIIFTILGIVGVALTALASTIACARLIGPFSTRPPPFPGGVAPRPPGTTRGL